MSNMGLTVLAYYPIFIKPVNNDLLVYIPDFKIYTEANGKTIDQTTDMAKDAIINTLFESKKFVKPSDLVEAYDKAHEDADDICDYSQNSMLTFVEVDISDYVNWDLYRFEDTECLEEELEYAKFRCITESEGMDENKDCCMPYYEMG